MSASFNHWRAGGDNLQTNSSGHVTFEANDTSSYSASGAFTTTLGYHFFQSHLRDITDGVFLFQSTADNYGDSTSGSLSGFLVAGHLYQWYYNATAVSGSEDTAGSGSASISFVSAVPEPTTLMIWSSLGLGGLVCGRRRRVS